ncbi:MAG TPA: hypothetical protein VH143_22445 [Kofleriaceae bacterium]|nr:hypothetical protein [Kofleriaceae bacterium]
MCIAAWTGGYANTFRGDKIDEVVHFLDVDLTAYDLTKANYKKHWNDSTQHTKKILFDDSANNYRNVAFRLSAASG